MSNEKQKAPPIETLAPNLIKNGKYYLTTSGDIFVKGQFRVTWDVPKLGINLVKLGISILDVAWTIPSTFAIAFRDKKHSDIEERWNLIGWCESKKRVLFLAFCVRDNGLEKRIISARLASKKERKSLADNFPSTNFSHV